MVDINPAALVTVSTPVLSNKSINVAPPSITKAPKISQLIPPRIDLEPIYTSLKAAIGAEQWTVYKEATSQFLLGRLNQVEYSERIDPVLLSPDGQREHLHNQLIAAIYGNVTREMPDQGLAPWVSANDKPSAGAGNKPVSGDAAERRLKGEVMQLPARDRRRLKDLVHNDFDPYEAMANVFVEHHKAKAPPKTAEIPASAGGLSRMNFDLEIRKRFEKPLAVESGEFPDVSNIEARMLPFCYEAGLTSGHVPDAAQFMSLATETFIKEMLSSVFSRTRSNPPGDSGSAGLGPGSSWVLTHQYRRQLAREEDAVAHGEVSRDKSGLLPVEARAAGERGPLGMADLRLALEIGDCGMANFPVVAKSVLYSYREGELENWDDYMWIPERDRPREGEWGRGIGKGGGILGGGVKPIVGGPVGGVTAAITAAAGGEDVEMGGVTVNAIVNGNVNGKKPDGTTTTAMMMTPMAIGTATATSTLTSTITATTGMLPNGIGGHGGADLMEIDSEDSWEGAESLDGDFLDGVLDSCLTVGSG